MQPDKIKIFGEHEEGTLAQIRRCATHDAAQGAVLCADGHKGYAMPIGGVIAYEDKISPSGVGYDIACLAAGTRVTTSHGYWLPIEEISADECLPCWDGSQVRLITEHVGHVPRGRKPVLRLKLANGRTLHATSDHLIRASEGWKRADALALGEKVACQPFVGLPYAGNGRGSRDVCYPPIPVDGLEARHREVLAAYGLDPLRLGSPALVPLLRLLGAICGDGHLTRNGRRIGIYTTDEADAEAIRQDFARLGYQVVIFRRKRYEQRKTEIFVYVNSTALHALCGALGAPVGKKDWPVHPMPWLFALPAWARAQFLSGFCSAVGSTPRIGPNNLCNLAVKQTGANENAIRFVARLFESLCFEVSIAPSGPARGDRQDYVLQLLGGAAEQVRYYEEVGFCYATEKRRRAADAASVAWALAAQLRNREQARHAAVALRQTGLRYKDVIARIMADYGVSYGFVYRALYDQRGQNRRERGASFAPNTSGEICWVPLASIEDGGEACVYDVATSDSAHCFFAEGVVVHNCGNKAVLTDAPAAEVRTHIKTLMDDVWANLSFGIGRNNDTRVEHELFDDPAWKLQPVKSLKQMAQNQLGTIGSGNHYVDLFADEQERIWIGVHFGSRGLGHKTATYFLKEGGAKDGMDVDPLVLPVDAPLGSDYLACMTLAGRYAYAGRDWVCSEVARILGATILEEVHNHHNFAWSEVHQGRNLWVVRKGATPAFPGQKGFVGGSMGDQSVILEGIESEEAKDSLYSTVHGAGRVMSRTAARGKINRRTGEVISPGSVSREMMNAWIRDRGVELRGAGTDESPHCYKRLDDVLGHHQNSIRILHTLTPLGVAMAGEGEVDPYKD
jgi:tRNA-splicing ligase RtcB